MYISEIIAFCIMHVFEAFSNIKIMFLNITDFIALFVSIPCYIDFTQLIQ